MDRQALAIAIRSVVKIHAVCNYPDYEQPWQFKGPASSTGSGVVIRTSRGLRILTNAHVTEYQVFLEVRRHGDARRFVADIEGVGHDCDLALLTLADDEFFFAGVEPIARGVLPRLSDRVSACGFPIGGEHISITEGVVSRIDLTSYAQSQRHLLAVQIDAAINAGNSGGPVIQDGKLVGIAFQALDEAQNIGYMIAPPVIEHFLTQLEHGGARGFPDLGVVAQRLESRAHRRALGLPAGTTGVLVNRVIYEGSCWGVLKDGDVLLAIDGVSLASDGTVPFGDGQLIHFSYLVSQRFVGEQTRLSVWRAGQRLECDVKLRTPALLVNDTPADRPPRYLLYGGLLFVPLTREYLRSWGDEWWMRAPRGLIALYEEELRTEARREVVVLQRVLPDTVNQGYHEVENLVITRAGGVPVSSFAHLARLIDEAHGELFEFESPLGRRVVLDRAEVAERDPGILQRFGAQRARSAEL